MFYDFVTLPVSSHFLCGGGFGNFSDIFEDLKFLEVFRVAARAGLMTWLDCVLGAWLCSC